jgi:YD repeat-containing protein
MERTDPGAPGEDYAGAWSAERGRCHRYVYDEHSNPTEWPRADGDVRLGPGRSGPLERGRCLRASRLPRKLAAQSPSTFPAGYLGPSR